MSDIRQWLQHKSQDRTLLDVIDFINNESDGKLFEYLQREELKRELKNV